MTDHGNFFESSHGAFIESPHGVRGEAAGLTQVVVMAFIDEASHSYVGTNPAIYQGDKAGFESVRRDILLTVPEVASVTAIVCHLPLEDPSFDPAIVPDGESFPQGVARIHVARPCLLADIIAAADWMNAFTPLDESNNLWVYTWIDDSGSMTPADVPGISSLREHLKTRGFSGDITLGINSSSDERWVSHLRYGLNIWI